MSDTYDIGDMINNWKIIDILNQDKHPRNYHYIIKCQSCQTTQREVTKCQLKRLGKQCNSCATIARNIKNREVKIGNKYGKLTVIGDGGYQNRNDGKRRHFSLVQCDCGKTKPFLVMDNCLQNGNTQSCGCLHSKGEWVIQQFLEKHNINFIKEYIFNDLKSEEGINLRFDFYLPEQNICIEFDGRQHYQGYDKNSSWLQQSKQTLEKIQQRDNLKNQYCQDHNIKLIRLNYKDYNCIYQKLREGLKEVMPYVDE